MALQVLFAPVAGGPRRSAQARNYYGTPLLHGLQVTSVVGVIAVAALALGIGAVRFARKDIAV